MVMGIIKNVCDLGGDHVGALTGIAFLWAYDEFGTIARNCGIRGIQ
jgi:hypothetical protein